ALLHLVRPGLGEETFRREADRFADIGKLLSGARDRHVMQQTLAKLETRPGALPRPTAQRMRKLVAPPPEPEAGEEQTTEGQADEGHADGGQASQDGRRPALAGLKQARAFFAGKALHDLELEHIVEGLGLTYRKARKAMRKAYAKPS